MIGNLTGESFLIALSGIVIVFLMLAVLCLLIPVISRIVQFFEARGAKPTAAEPQTPPAPAPTVLAGTAFAGEVTLIDVDEKTAACIMAIVSHETGIPLSELIFKTIRAL
nr:OadG family protein [uncultured Butyricicoccus sp.]